MTFEERSTDVGVYVVGEVAVEIFDSLIDIRRWGGETNSCNVEEMGRGGDEKMYQKDFVRG